MERCIYPGTFYLPKADSDLTAWACVACDQFTSQPDYWRQADLLVGQKPSTLRMILPECYLAQMQDRVPAIHQAMSRYLADGTLQPAVQNGYVLMERNTPSGARLGLVVTIDLERYDYHKGSKSPVRATEETIESRLPARIAVRQGGALETSHVLMLMDDPMHSVIEPLFARRGELEKLYDFPLMLEGGHLVGYAVTRPQDIRAIDDALAALRPHGTLRFAVGDGNHSLACAKACWEALKPVLSPAETATHPARFAMVELENIHDDALTFEPIHRVLFGYDGDDLLNDLAAYAAANGMSLAGGPGGQEITCVYEGKQVTLSISGSPYGLPVGTLQAFLDQWLTAHPTARLDYVHGEGAVRSLAAQPNTIGFLLPKPDGGDLFDSVEANGSLPRKTFSLGEANEKRYYMECRRIIRE